MTRSVVIVDDHDGLVSDLAELVDTLRRVDGGGSAIDPDIVARLLAHGDDDPHTTRSGRELDVLAPMAERRSNQWGLRPSRTLLGT